MRLCMIGNSHLAALISAWRLVKDQYPTLDCTFFGARGSRLNGLEVNDGKLIAKSNKLTEFITKVSSGKSCIDGDYDAYVLVGLQFKFIPFQHYHSTAFMQACCQERWQSTLSYRLTQKIQTISNAPIYLAHCPLPADDGCNRDGSLANYDTQWAIWCSELAAKNVHLLRQPADTLSAPLYTQHCFSQRSKRLTVVGESTFGEEHAIEDYAHMNEVYGQHYLASALPRILDDKTHRDAVSSISTA